MIESLNAIVARISEGKSYETVWNKQTGAVAYTNGRWYDFQGLAGSPIGNNFAGTALAWQQCDNGVNPAGVDFGIYTGGNVSPDIKHALKVGAVTAFAAGVPGVLMLVDMIGYYPGIAINSLAVQNLTGTPTHRYTGGKGCKLFFRPTVAAGTGARSYSVSYTNSAGTAGRALPFTVSGTASAPVDQIDHAGTAANQYGPFLPLASGDVGVQSVQTFQFSAAATAGTGALCLARPLLELPITTIGVMSERDLVNQVRTLPRIPDNATLTWLYFAGASTLASTQFYGTLDTVWG